MIAQVEVAEKPILFRGEMIRKILDGSKSQTRRVIKPPNDFPFAGDAPYDPGDRLWVRETYFIDDWECVATIPKTRPPGFDERSLYFRADGECCEQIPECECGEVGPTPWRPSIFMPHWASRITLEVTGVRVQRVQEISADDAIKEGVPLEKHRCDCEVCAHTPTHCTATQSSLIMAYAELWDSINEKRGFGWDKNPWVWALTFKNVPK